MHVIVIAIIIFFNVLAMIVMVIWEYKAGQAIFVTPSGTTLASLAAFR